CPRSAACSPACGPRPRRHRKRSGAGRVGDGTIRRWPASITTAAARPT
ncbi:MAG: hypothetical protein AVDCRST_MAG18-1932, partial [uncultured Thermomicrobiales bacterium]